MMGMKSSSNLIKFCDGEGNVLSMKREERGGDLRRLMTRVFITSKTTR